MKFSHVFLLVLIALVGLTTFVQATEREVRSYTADMEYVDHVDLSNTAAEDLPVNVDHAMMETSSEHNDEAAPAENEMHFSMEAENELEQDLSASFLEADAAEEIDTAVMRAMALEIHDAAQAHIDENGDVMTALIESDAETDSESDSDADADAEFEAESDAEDAAEEDDHALIEQTPIPANATAYFGLNATEIASSQADHIADIKDDAAEKLDNAEAETDKAQAAVDAAGTVKLPEDLSAQHAQTIAVNEAATATIQKALGEMGGILAAKDDTIRSLVYNISYLTVNMGKLANKVDLQRTYIGLLQQKLALSEAKNQELTGHVSSSAQTVLSIRAQLKDVEDRLNNQDKTTEALSTFLTKNADNIQLPSLGDDLTIIRPANPPTTLPVNPIRRLTTRFRPVPNTQIYADADYVAARFVPQAAFDGIPTIVVEREDNGQ